MTFNPQAGHEQAGRRPALVLSPVSYNRKAGMVILCQVTSQQKNYPFEVAIPPGLPIQGVILCDQIKNLDWNARNAEFICRLPDETVREALEKASTLLRP
jgi:mRNA interferase MazF